MTISSLDPAGGCFHLLLASRCTHYRALGLPARIDRQRRGILVHIGELLAAITVPSSLLAATVHQLSRLRCRAPSVALPGGRWTTILTGRHGARRPALPSVLAQTGARPVPPGTWLTLPAVATEQTRWAVEPRVCCAIPSWRTALRALVTAADRPPSIEPAPHRAPVRRMTVR